MQNRLIITLLMIFVFGVICFDTPPSTMSATFDDAGDECRTAITIAQAFLPSVTKLDQWKLTVAKNLLVDGSDCCNPVIWQLTYRSKSLISDT